MSAGEARILVVDDDETLRNMLVETLRGEGYAVDGAANGSDGLGRLRGDPQPNLVLLDMRMPDMDGMGFLQQGRDALQGDAIPVVIISATPELPEGTPELGVKAMITKPFDMGLLLAVVERLVRPGTARTD